MGPRGDGDVAMILATALLACLLVLADGVTTLRGLRASMRESNPVRRFLIRVLGVVGGTIGVAVAICVVIAAVNFYSKQPDLALIIGNLLIVAAYGAAVWHNLRVTK